jgi:hypothetical protein
LSEKIGGTSLIKAGSAVPLSRLSQRSCSGASARSNSRSPAPACGFESLFQKVPERRQFKPAQSVERLPDDGGIRVGQDEIHKHRTHIPVCPEVREVEDGARESDAVARRRFARQKPEQEVCYGRALDEFAERRAAQQFGREREPARLFCGRQAQVRPRCIAQVGGQFGKQFLREFRLTRTDALRHHEL